MKYFIYTRKSSEESYRQAQSLETQQRMLTDYSKDNQLEIIAIISETKSAKDEDNREKFSKMLVDIQNGIANAILVAHLDRLTRNRKETGELIKLFEKGVLKEIRTPYRTYDSIHDLFSMDYEFLSAVHYSARLSIRVKEGNQTKLLKGEWPGVAKVGYLNVDKKIIIDPDRKHYIEQMFKLYIDGKPLQYITDYLYENGLRTRTGHKVHRSTIQRLLQEPFYIGKMKYDGKIYQGNHPPIISEELFELAQQRFAKKTFFKPPIKDLKFIYRRRIKCAKCGCYYCPTVKKNTYKYYFCTNGKRICDEHKKYIREEEINNFVKGIIDQFFVDKEMINKSLDLYIQKLHQDFNEKEITINNLENELKSTEQRESKLLDLYIDEKIAETVYNEKLKELTGNKKRLNKQIEVLRTQNPEEIISTLELAKNRMISIQTLFNSDNFEVKDNLLKSLLWNFSLEDGKVTSVQYKQPFLSFEKASKSGEMSDETVTKRVLKSSIYRL